MTTEKNALWRSRLKMVAVIACFAVPYGIANFYFSSVKQGGVFASKANGVLIEPAAPLGEFRQTALGDAEPVDQEMFRGQWTLVLFQDGQCDDACTERLYFSRQVRVMLGREMYRVRRLLVTDAQPSDDLREEHLQLLYAGADAGEVGLGAQVRSAVGDTVFDVPGELYLIDPLGNLVMRFPPDLPAKAMLKDLKTLLKASRIG